MPPKSPNWPPMKESAFWKRLVSAAEAAGQKTTQEGLGNLVNAAQSSARKWMTGESLPTMENVRLLGYKLGVSVEWLLTGRGPRKPVKALPDDLLEIAELWSHMDEERRAELLGFAKYCRTISNVPPHQSAPSPIRRSGAS